jgi:hypothetical protein
MSDELEIRVSDVEREQAVARLRDASTEGRLTLETSVLAIFAPIRDLGDAGPLTPAAPRIRVNGVSIFAPVFVKHRRS